MELILVINVVIESQCSGWLSFQGEGMVVKFLYFMRMLPPQFQSVCCWEPWEL